MNALQCESDLCLSQCMFVVAVVRGITYLDKIMYVICDGSYSHRIRLYNIDTCERLDISIDVVGMKNPWDIVVCHHDRQLYVADWNRPKSVPPNPPCIWRVSADDHSHMNWLPAEEFNNPQLSLTSRHLVVTSSNNIRQYSTADGRLLSVIKPPEYMQWLCHAVKTGRQTFVVGHRGTAKDKEQFAVSELFGYCHSFECTKCAVIL